MKKLLMAVLILASAPALAARGHVPPGGFKPYKAAKAAGYWDIRRGEPAYSKRLDRDGDGVAREKVSNFKHHSN